MTVLAGLDYDEGRAELRKMIDEGLVDEKKLQGFPLYKLSFRGRDQATCRIRLVVDNEPNTG